MELASIARNRRCVVHWPRWCSCPPRRTHEALSELGSLKEERMDKVVCKFKVTAVSAFEGDCGEVKLQAVKKSETDNQDWSKWTPSGEMRMSITNLPALQFFSPGEEIDIVLTKAKKADP
jgi:hypothetical protein